MASWGRGAVVQRTSTVAAAMMTIDDGGSDQRSTVRAYAQLQGSGAGCRRSDRERGRRRYRIIGGGGAPMDGSCAGGGRALNANASPAGLCAPPAARGVAHEAWCGHATRLLCLCLRAAPSHVSSLARATGRPQGGPQLLDQLSAEESPPRGANNPFAAPRAVVQPAEFLGRWIEMTAHPSSIGLFAWS